MSRLPTFLIIGAPKAGTTSLWAYLHRHPQVFMSTMKELDFFVTTMRWNRGLEWYRKQFEDAGEAIAVGEASPNYTNYPPSEGIPARIAGVIPDARLIYLVRHPIERMISHYRHAMTLGRQPPIDTALLDNPAYLTASRYAMHIQQYLEHFPRERMLILRSEALRDDREATLRRVHRFLGVSEGWVPADLGSELNSTKGVRQERQILSRLRKLPGYRALASVTPSAMKRLKRRITTHEVNHVSVSPDVRRRLEESLRPDLERLSGYIGEDLGGKVWSSS